jgi:hypothetical protein
MRKSPAKKTARLATAAIIDDNARGRDGCCLILAIDDPFVL